MAFLILWGRGCRCGCGCRVVMALVEGWGGADLVVGGGDLAIAA